DLNLLDWKTPSYDQAFLDLRVMDFKKDLALFKGTKAFFEKNEKDMMKEAIYQTLIPYIKSYIQASHKLMKESYSSQWQLFMETRKQQLLKDIVIYVENNLTVTENAISLTKLEN